MGTKKSAEATGAVFMSLAPVSIQADRVCKWLANLSLAWERNDRNKPPTPTPTPCALSSLSLSRDKQKSGLCLTCMHTTSAPWLVSYLFTQCLYL